jgi:hypothetical protein
MAAALSGNAYQYSGYPIEMQWVKSTPFLLYRVTTRVNPLDHVYESSEFPTP